MAAVTIDSIKSLTDRITDPKHELRTRLAAIMELKEISDKILPSPDYAQIVPLLVPALCSTLDSTPPSFNAATLEQRFKNTTILVLYRLPMDDNLQPFIPELINVLTNVIKTDNEENGTLSIKFLSSIFRSYKNAITDKVQPFLDLVCNIYRNMPAVVRESFELSSAATATPGTAPAATSPESAVNTFSSPWTASSPGISSDVIEGSIGRPLAKAMYSFKVLTECPIIVVMLFTAHKEFIEPNLTVFIEQVIQMLRLEAPAQAEARPNAEAHNELYTIVSPAIKNRHLFGEFITAQVKTMSFLAYALRTFSSSLENYHKEIPEFVVRLLQDCPRELSASRKELLVATRHFLSTDVRTAFIPKIDILLERNVLVGDGLTVYETLRPLAYSMVADLIHHVRNELSVKQIWKAVRVYCANMQDMSLSNSFHIMSAKLLLNLVERIMQLQDNLEGRQLLITIISAFADKFAQLNMCYPHALASAYKDTKSDDKSASDEMQVDTETNSNTPLDFFDTNQAFPIKIGTEPRIDGLKDGKNLFKGLMTFLRTSMFGLKNCNPPPPATDKSDLQWNDCVRGLTYDEVLMFRKLFREGIKCFSYFSSPKSAAVNEQNSAKLESSLNSKEERENMEFFATVFIHIDPPSFNEILEAEMENLYTAIAENSTLLYLPQFFLSSEATSTNCVIILMDFLVKNLENLGKSDSAQTSVMMRLFKLSFMAVNLFPTANEDSLLPYLQKLIVSCMKLSTSAEEPLNYFILLRTLFRSIGGGRFEKLYKEVLPLLQTLLDSLNNLLLSSRIPQARDLYVELCLTVPVRLSVLVPHLSYLMLPLVIALRDSPELVSQGLRTLELCVDNLTAEYFDPILEPYISDVMAALWSHLRPLPYSHVHAHTALRILGKLGGRNRRFLQPPDDFEFRRYLKEDPAIYFKLNGIKEAQKFEFVVPVAKHAIQLLDNPRLDSRYHSYAFKYLAEVSKMLFRSARIPEGYESTMHNVIQLSLMENPPKFTLNDEITDPDEKLSSINYLEACVDQENKFMQSVIEALFSTAHLPDVKNEAVSLLKNIAEHVILLEFDKVPRTILARTVVDFNIDKDLRVPHLDLIEGFLISLAHAMSSWRVETVDIAKEVENHMLDTLQKFFKNTADLLNFVGVLDMISAFCHTCHNSLWYVKHGGVIALTIIFDRCDENNKASLAWFHKRLFEIVRALLFVLKDISAETPTFVSAAAKELLLKILKQYCSQLTDDEVTLKKFQQLCGILAYDLVNPSELVRQSIKDAFVAISEITGKPQTELLYPVKATFLQPIFGKPLRALPFPNQVGNIDAVVFCMSLSEDFLEFNDELKRLIAEVMAIADADDESLASTQKVDEYRTSIQLVQLRIRCIKLLSLVINSQYFITSDEEQKQEKGQARARILAIFFKTLYLKDSEIVDAAHECLADYLAQNNKLPRDILQIGLKPILMNISDHTRLTVSGLEGLGRLLELLTKYFKVEIGHKLFDHLKTLSDPASLLAASSRVLWSQQKIKIMAAIYAVYHCLPAAASIFLNDLATTLLQLESQLHVSIMSPFRKPLALFTNRHHDESAAYFAARIKEGPMSHLFIGLLKEKCSTELRTVVTTKLNEIIDESIYTEENLEARSIGICNLIEIVSILSSYHSEFIKKNHNLFPKLIAMFADLHTVINTTWLTSPVHLKSKRAQSLLEELMRDYFTEFPTDSDTLYALIEHVVNEDISSVNTLHMMIFDLIVSNNDPVIRGSYLDSALKFASTASIAGKVYVFKYIINMILMKEAASRNDLTGLVEKASPNIGSKPNWLEQVFMRVWKNSSLDSLDEASGVIDKYRFQLLQLTCILIKYGAPLVNDIRKDIIKFLWGCGRIEDILSKHANHLVIVHFIDAFETPAKMVTQVYVSLLKSQQSEARMLVRESLDVLSVQLANRIGPSKWAKWVYRVLQEELQHASQVVNIFYFISTKRDMFYPHRSMFAAAMVSAIPKLAFSGSSPVDHASDNLVLAIDLADTIFEWIQRQKSETSDTESTEIQAPRRSKRKHGEVIKEGDEDVEPIVSEPIELSLNAKESLVSCLIRLICMHPKKVSDNELYRKIIKVLSGLLGPDVWPDVTNAIQLDVFERTIALNDADERSVNITINTLEVIHVVLENKPKEWVDRSYETFIKLLDQAIKCDSLVVHETLEKIIDFLLNHISATYAETEGDEENSMPDGPEQFVQLITQTIQDKLTTAVSASKSYGAGVILASSLVKFLPHRSDSLLPLFMKAFGRLCREHIMLMQQKSQQAASARNGSQSPENPIDTIQFEQTSSIIRDLIFRMLDIGKTRIAALGDQRRTFLSVLERLVEWSTDLQLCQKLLKLVYSWIFEPKEVFPTIKEKTMLVAKMTIFEARDNAELTEDFYDMVTSIFSHPQLLKTDLVIRLEHSFLIGTRIENFTVRKRLMNILDESLNRNAWMRLWYVLKYQNWESLSDSMWLNQALQLIYGAISKEQNVQPEGNRLTARPITSLFESIDENDGMQIDLDEDVSAAVATFLVDRKAFIDSMSILPIGSLLDSVVEMQYVAPEIVRLMWVNMFSVICSNISKRDLSELFQSLLSLFSRDYHTRQADKNPNVVSIMLEGLHHVSDKLVLPPHLIKFLGKAYNGWYDAIGILEEYPENSYTSDEKVREAALDALAELYSSLEESDMFYGLWRRRCEYTETNVAISHEQVSQWEKAQQLYEAAQIKARSGVLPYSEREYGLWEDHWILCEQKLQQWDVLTEIAKHENFTDLLLECAWRMADWASDGEPLEQSIKTVMDIPTPRRQVFEAFMHLQKCLQKTESLSDLSKSCDEGIQLSLRKWRTLPMRISDAHIPLLETFQRYVELMEASQIYQNLHATNVQNLESKTQELKGILQAWRERLPNVWDDFNIWSDLVTWRQNVFSVINKVYIPMVSALQAAGVNSSSANSYGYRGYHEIAWIINRFAHVARLQDMSRVCIDQLTKIYTLPNIEIQEAFLKLREQAKCHYKNPQELNTGLEVISNTNLAYFGAPQKAEFFTLKGMFLAKLQHSDEANQAYATAIQIDMNLPKAWAEWGRFNDAKFKENPNDLSFVSSAISCYLQAAGLYKSHKSRSLLGRVLWLLSLDDANQTLASAFESYQGETPVWYWILFIPQLLTSLSHKEARIARSLLIKIAKSYPQALHFQLRTTKDDYAVIQRQAMQAQNSKKNEKQATSAETPKNDKETPNDGQSSASPPRDNIKVESSGSTTNDVTANPQSLNRQPWEYVDEIMGILKTAYPLLSLALETMIDQICQRFKCTPEEDAYRLIVALLNDGAQFMNRMAYQNEDTKLPPATELNLTRIADSLLPPHIRKVFREDFVNEKPTLKAYVAKMRKWRDRWEERLDSRRSSVSLESLSPHLCEFHYQKFEEIDIPGQYLQLTQSNIHFAKIGRFLPDVKLNRGFGICYKQISIQSHSGSVHTFTIQYPAARHCRREERVLQLAQTMNATLEQKTESRRRRLKFTIPAAIPLTPHIRIIQDNPNNITMQGIYEDWCKTRGQYKDEPIIFAMQKFQEAFDANHGKPDHGSLKFKILQTIQETLVPDHVLRDYFVSVYKSFEEFWLFRKQFSYQYAGVAFLTFMLSINGRYPHKIVITRSSGSVWSSEMLPLLPSQNQFPQFQNTERVPFRLTPNLQRLMGDVSLEGLFSPCMMVISKCLTDEESDLEDFLSLFVRDEVISWYTQQHRPAAQDQQLRDIVQMNVEKITKKAASMSQPMSAKHPTNQAVINLIAQAVNPRDLALADNLWLPYL
ncbi:hypothetical protein CANCADRAFT_52791 [Tortispora caseinolytica NRRL Y-17796]|uniref:Non-specific serine/threonine protein kinase n=1 Tax=Tortispora caseinolytica NRRL Y-17796 TaxID=767744 RepID=A0A1E4TAB9_9ASCO|nr:hypothetical protein CANCADRAFT_52791 [Tortispora caseinolytica NRRL Y-17796]